jgi:hypothetical protein
MGGYTSVQHLSYLDRCGELDALLFFGSGRRDNCWWRGKLLHKSFFSNVSREISTQCLLHILMIGECIVYFFELFKRSFLVFMFFEKCQKIYIADQLIFKISSNTFFP